MEFPVLVGGDGRELQLRASPVFAQELEEGKWWVVGRDKSCFLLPFSILGLMRRTARSPPHKKVDSVGKRVGIYAGGSP